MTKTLDELAAETQEGTLDLMWEMQKKMFGMDPTLPRPKGPFAPAPEPEYCPTCGHQTNAEDYE